MADEFFFRGRVKGDEITSGDIFWLVLLSLLFILIGDAIVDFSDAGPLRMGCQYRAGNQGREGGKLGLTGARKGDIHPKYDDPSGPQRISRRHFPTC